MKKFLKNWKTTLVGVLAVALYAVSSLFGVDSPEVASWGEAIAVIGGITGIGVFAKDGDKRSEDLE